MVAVTELTSNPRGEDAIEDGSFRVQDVNEQAALT